VSGVIQILFGLFRAGTLGDLFPLSAVHGMLAAIGIIIISKQSYLVFGIDPPKDAGPIGLLTALPERFLDMNPEIALIGVMSLVILFGMPFLNFKWIKKIPTPMIVILLAIPVGMYFDLDHKHTFLFPHHFFDTEHYDEFEVGPQFLVSIPNVLDKPADAFALPDFRGLATATGLQYLVLFALIGSLESLLSAKAVDLLDPKKRKTNLNRDLTAVGVANTVSAAIGGMPMISEIVRSSANINNGAASKFSNFFHGLFLLAFVLLIPNLIHRIPLAALGAMLVYTGFRLASPREFVKTWHIGIEQLAVCVTTIVMTLATDLLIGIASGIALEFLMHLMHGVTPWSVLKPAIEVGQIGDNSYRIVVSDPAVFANWLALKNRVLALGDEADVEIDLTNAKLIDHTVMEKLHELEAEFERRGRRLEVTGLHEHWAFSKHPKATRKKSGKHAKVV